MSVAAVQTKNSSNNTTSSVAISITTTAGNLLGISTVSNNTTSAPSRTGDANNSAIADFNVGAAIHMRGDYMKNIGGNSNSVTLSSSAGWCKGCVTEFSGADTSSPLGATHPTNTITGGTSTIQPGSITPTAGSALFTAVGGDQNSSSAATINTGGQTGNFTVDETGGAGTVWDGTATPDSTGSAHHDNVSAVATNPTWTLPASATNALAMMIEFLTAAGGGATPVPPLMRTLRMAGV